jgi:acyl carrier protein
LLIAAPSSTLSPIMEDQAQKIINRAIDRINELLPTDQPLPKDPQTPLLGQKGRLDSMQFVNLLVALEEELEAQLGRAVVLADAISPDEGIATIADLHTALARIIQASQQAGSSAGIEQ